MTTHVGSGAQYEAPKVTVWGSLAALTAQSASGTKTDVPLGTHVPPFTIFS